MWSLGAWWPKSLASCTSLFNTAAASRGAAQLGKKTKQNSADFIILEIWSRICNVISGAELLLTRTFIRLWKKWPAYSRHIGGVMSHPTSTLSPERQSLESGITECMTDSSSLPCLSDLCQRSLSKRLPFFFLFSSDGASHYTIVSAQVLYRECLLRVLYPFWILKL